MVSEEDRSAINANHKRGMPIPVIAKSLKFHRKQVHRVVQRFEETGGIKDRQREGRPRSARTPKLMNMIRKKIQRNPQRSIRKLAREHEVSHETMRKLITDDLELVPYKLTKGQLLTDQNKESRLEKCRKMKNLSRGDALQRILFTDEKIFTVQPYRNSQNQRELLPKGSPRVVKRENVHFPQSIMVWGGISGLGKTKLVFVPKGAKINADTYRELILEGAVIPWAQENAENIEWSLQQDWAPAHGAKKTLQWCEANLPSFWSKDVWPSNSPDLNPLDFSVWGIMEQKACAVKHKSVGSLKRALEKAWDEISPEMIAAILKNFRKRLDACIAARGSHFE
ncbi:hypothetical protein QR680_013281 [Steinernema hermaphroditum]|uniref:Tc1-like transposase DDE domain-containing protein n=1 Tax=Steinernema hermaphroditum TaxID=289476 RepID=A0AA39I4Z5_9BILA|nr:hypothetical protein QR680_013281 [Steinernema hermaphroditum]